MGSDKRLVIAVDGPAASGKGTLARRLAERLGLVYLDTGLLYRYVGYKIIKTGKEVEEAENHASALAEEAILFAKTPFEAAELQKHDLSGEDVGKAASIVSAIPEVRKALLIFQKDVAKSPVGAVLDGRDIGTEVCPDADLKFFITASIETRAKRRFKQLQILGKDVIYSDILHDLEARDRRDKNRQVAPLISAEDAVSIDTTDMNHEEVFEMVCAIVDAK